MKKFTFKKLDNGKVDLKCLPASMAATLTHARQIRVSEEALETFFTPYHENTQALIKVKNINMEFSSNRKTNKVLKDVTFKINKGENIAVLGANGAGKSTMFNIIIGILKPTSGTISYNYEYKKNFLEEIGIQFQDSSYPRGISTRDVLQFMISIYNATLSQAELDGLIEIFGIDEFISKGISNLSGGQKQRLNALLAVIHKPKVIFLDELSNGLDISIRNRIKSFIKNFAKENGMTLCVVSHDVSEIEYLVDRIVILVEGKVMVNAYKDEIVKKWGSVAKFIDYYIN